MARNIAIVDRPIIPGVGWRLRAWLFLIFLLADLAYTSFSVGNGDHTQAKIGAVIGLLGTIVAAINTVYGMPANAPTFAPWLTTDRCWAIYRVIAVLGTIMLSFGWGSDEQWATFLTGLGTIFGLTAANLRTSLVKAVNAPEGV